MKKLITLFTLSSCLFAVTAHSHSSHSHAPKKQEATVTQPQANSEQTVWQDTVTITIPAKDDIEYKVMLTKGQTFEHSWKADKGELFYDFHGEPKGDTTGYFKTFEKDTKASAGGSLSAEFEGTHGWYWKNSNKFPVEVTLNLSGDYARIDIPVDQATAAANAQAAISSLVQRGKLDKSWEAVAATSTETIEFNGKSEWKVIFDNGNIADAKKQKLYVFLTINGQYIAANYSGK